MSEHRSLISTVQRVGRDGVVFDMYKIPGLTMLSADEVGQVLNILQRHMNLFGHRPLLPADFEQFMDTIDPAQRDAYWRNVMPKKPGVLSSFAVESHAYGTLGPHMRAELDIQDVLEGRVANRRIARQAILLGFPYLLPRQLRKLISH